MTDPGQGGLRARRQARTRAAIVDAAIALFTEHGYDAVTVSDIATRAEVGRTTFFRYFHDKSDVLFADDEALSRTLLDAAEHAATADPDPGRGLPYALRVSHAALRELTRRIAGYGDTLAPYHRLILGHDGLRARSLLNQMRYMDGLAAVLRRHDVPAGTATLGVHIALACYRTASAVADRPARLAAALDDAFAEVYRLGDAAPSLETAS